VMELSRVGRLEAVHALARASNEMSVGELRQLVSYDALDFSEEGYDRLIACKTASLMSTACDMGGLVGVDAYRESFRRFGEALGMAFQIADDLLDYEGSEEVTGKPVGHDLRERKVTLPLIEAMRRVGPEDRSRIRAFFTRLDPSNDEIDEIVDLVRRVGGLDYARERAGDFAAQAEAALGEIPEQGEAMEALRASIVYAVERSR
jgi:octaprenyl-diphosphate synthase